jgi:hypothetical protein
MKHQLVRLSPPRSKPQRLLLRRLPFPHTRNTVTAKETETERIKDIITAMMDTMMITLHRR